MHILFLFLVLQHTQTSLQNLCGIKFEQIKIINLDPRVLETTLHHALADYQLELEIKSPNGKMIRPREWFVIDLSRVEKIINSIIAMIQSEQ